MPKVAQKQGWNSAVGTAIPANYDDTLAAGVALETSAINVLQDFNGLRSQVNRMIGLTNWFDAMPDGGSFNLDTFVNNFMCGAQVLTDVAVLGGSTNWVVLSDIGLETPTVGGNTADATSSATEGAVCATSALTGVPFAVNELTERGNAADGGALSPLNLVSVIDSTTRQVITTDNGNDVLALMQVESTFSANGAAFDDAANRVKLSFVRVNAAGDNLEAVPFADIAGKTINYNYPLIKLLGNVDPSCFTGKRGFVDQTASIDVTRQNAYANQGTGVVSAVVTATLKLDEPGVSWIIQDDLSSPLLSITEGSLGGTSVVSLGPSVDTFSSNAILNNFTNGIRVDLGAGSTVIGVGFVANTITSGGVLILDATGDVDVTLIAGERLDLNQAGDETNAIIAMRSSSTEGVFEHGIFSGDGDPQGVVTALAGSLFLDDTGLAYINTSTADTEGVDWTPLSTGSVETLSDVVANVGTSPSTQSATFEWRIDDAESLSFTTDVASNENLLSLAPAVGGDIVTIGNTVAAAGVVVNAGTAGVDINTTGALDANVNATSTFALDTDLTRFDWTDGTNLLMTIARDDSGDTVQIGGGADTVATFEVDVSGGFSLDANSVSSNVTNTGGALSIESLGAGSLLNLRTTGTTVGGEIDITAGNGTTTGGTVDINAGSGVTTGVGGDVSIDAGAGGITSGDGGNVTIASGGVTSGNGGDVTLTAAASTAANEGGVITMTSGAGGVTAGGGGINANTGAAGGGNTQGGDFTMTFGDGAGTGDPGQLTLKGDQDSGQSWFQFTGGAGGNAVEVAMFSGIGSPSGAVDAFTSSLYHQDDNSTGALWLNTSAGGSGTVWEELTTTADAEDRQDVYNNQAATVVTVDTANYVGATLDLIAGAFWRVRDDVGKDLLSLTDLGQTALAASDAAVAGNTGSNVVIDAGDGLTTGSGGGVAIAGGAGGNGALAAGGSVFVDGGAADVASTGPGGSITLTSGVGGGVSGDGGGLLLYAGNAGVGGAGIGGPTFLASGNGVGANPGGEVDITAGNGGVLGGGIGGAIDVNAGNAGAASAAAGGAISMTGGTGDGLGVGGAINILGGDGSAGGSGGAVSLQGGPGNDSGGSATVQGGTGTGVGGEGAFALIQGGTPTTDAGGGNVLINGGDSGATATNTGGDVLGTGGDGGGTSGAGGLIRWTGGAGVASGATGGLVESIGGVGVGAGLGGAGNLTGGAGGSNGSGGDVGVTGGASGAAAGDGGTVAIAAGATTLGNGGDVTLTAAASVGSNEGGVVSMTAGVGGVTAGGGGINANTGAAGGGNTDGGSFTMTFADGAGTGIPGQLTLKGPHDADNSWFQFIADGAGPGTAVEVAMFSGIDVPNGTIDAFTTSLYHQDDNSTGALWLNTSAGGSGTVWEELATSTTIALLPRQEPVTTDNITGDTPIGDTLDALPVSNASVRLFLNGVEQRQGVGADYTVSGVTITWLAGTGTAVDMDTTDVLDAIYDSAA